MSSITLGPSHVNLPPDDAKESPNPISCESPHEVKVLISQMKSPSNQPFCEARPLLNKLDSSNESHSPIYRPSPRQVRVIISRKDQPPTQPLRKEEWEFSKLLDPSKGKSHI